MFFHSGLPLYIITLLFVNFCTTVVRSEVGQLPFCDPATSNSPQRSLVYISTLDGTITALDIAKNGEKVWTLDFDKKPLLSSNIHRRELSNNGQWVKLIPSLKGSLYKFDGENLESVPVTPEQLLKSSFRYSDDLVFSGGRETKSYGISTVTGKIVYECNMNGCANITTGDNYVEQELIIVQRYQQIVRAVDPRSGTERWNFSVGLHELTKIPRDRNECFNKNLHSFSNIDIQVIVPEGLVWAISKSNPLVKLWEHKFDSPIVTIWRDGKDLTSQFNVGLKEVNLFDNTQWTSESASAPALYVGMHERQLYIQENPEYEKSLDYQTMLTNAQFKYPWQPHPAIAFKEETANLDSNQELALDSSETRSTTALSVLYNSEYINGNGFYLYSKNQLHLPENSQCNKTHSKLITEAKISEEETPVREIIVSLWHYWKEVLVISITTAIVLNFMLTQRLYHITKETKNAMLPPVIIERHIESEKISNKVSAKDGNNFISRYLEDFKPVDCLGIGGYGIVFEAKNNLDDVHYAIKRISLTNSRKSRNRVMREVKTLAILEHPNVVRYFNAWLEYPPLGWQEEQDQLWLKTHQIANSDIFLDISQTDSKPESSVCIDVSQSGQSSVDSAQEACELNNAYANEDSYIVFSQPDSENKESNKPCTSEYSCNEISTETTSISDSQNSEEAHEDNPNSESIIFLESSRSKQDKKDEEESSLNDVKSRVVLNLQRKARQRPTKMYLYIQMQLCQRHSLREWLKNNNSSRDFNYILSIFKQIVDAVDYVHKKELIHRDLKPSNIFFTFDNQIKVGDFGLVTAMTEGYKENVTPNGSNDDSTCLSTCCMHTEHVGTRLYMSPEQMNGKIYNYKVDIYSLGIILFELLTPFSTEMERVTALTNLRKSIFPDSFSSQYPAEYDLLKMMLDEDPTKRPTTVGIKARPPLVNYISTLNVENLTEDIEAHFELPRSRNSSLTNSSRSNSSIMNS